MPQLYNSEEEKYELDPQKKTDTGFVSLFVLYFCWSSSKSDRAQDLNLDLPEVNINRLPLPLDEHDFVLDKSHVNENLLVLLWAVRYCKYRFFFQNQLLFRIGFF